MTNFLVQNSVFFYNKYAALGNTAIGLLIDCINTDVSIATSMFIDNLSSQSMPSFSGISKSIGISYVSFANAPTLYSAAGIITTF